LGSTLQLAATANITKQRFCMNFDQLNFALSLVNSTLGPFDVSILNLLISIALNTVVLPDINKIANAGVPLPTVEGLSFVNTELKFSAGFVNLASDLSYTPPAIQMEPETEWQIRFSAGEWPTADAIVL